MFKRFAQVQASYTSHPMALSALKQKLWVFGSLPNIIRKLTKQLCTTSRAVIVHPTCTYDATHMRTTEWVRSKMNTPNFLKYGGECGYSLFNSVPTLEKMIVSKPLTKFVSFLKGLRDKTGKNDKSKSQSSM